MDATATFRSIAKTNLWTAPVIAVSAVLLGASPPARAAEGHASASIGAEYTEGDYGTSSTTKIWYFPLTLEYETDENLVSVTIPYVIVNGTGNVVPGGMGGGMGMVRPTGQTGSETESGFGDIVLTGSHKLGGTATSRVDLTGMIKFGTADEDKNLGTGEDDFAVQLDFAQGYNENTLYGSGGYRIIGDPPGTNYNNVFYGTLGLSRRLDNANSAGVEFFAQEAVLSGIDGQSQLTLFLSNRPDNKTKLTGYFLLGLADGSPDWGIGVTLKLSQ
jgi:hypothetical protein